MSISILGAGAFGTALAISLARNGQKITLWARDAEQVENMQERRENALRLEGHHFPDSLIITGNISTAGASDTLLLATPMQKLSEFMHEHKALLNHRKLVACCKGVSLATGLGPVATIKQICPDAIAAILTGPSFANDIARGLPTALTIACENAAAARDLQAQLSTDNLRLYRTTDSIGAELGGALKNVIAIACGAAIGAGLGESARAALMTRGYAEMQRLAQAMGAQPETLAGLCGFGDLTLTCTSTQSRNYSYGISLGQAASFGKDITVEGAKTSFAIDRIAKTREIEMPITAMIVAIINREITIQTAMETLFSRPLTKE